MADTGKIVLRYIGPAQQVCYALGEYGYPPILRRDTRYELPTEFAEGLLASNAHFVNAEGYTFPPKEETPAEHYRFLVSDGTQTGSATMSGMEFSFAGATASLASDSPDPEQSQGE